MEGNIESNACDRVYRAAETAEQNELSKPRTKARARNAVCATAEVVSRSHTQIIALYIYIVIVGNST